MVVVVAAADCLQRETGQGSLALGALAEREIGNDSKT